MYIHNPFKQVNTTLFQTDLFEPNLYYDSASAQSGPVSNGNKRRIQHTVKL